MTGQIGKVISGKIRSRKIMSILTLHEWSCLIKLKAKTFLGPEFFVAFSKFTFFAKTVIFGPNVFTGLAFFGSQNLVRLAAHFKLDFTGKK